MEKIKQRLIKNNALDSVLSQVSDRVADAQELELADDSDAFTSSITRKTAVDITLRLKLSESANILHATNDDNVGEEDMNVPVFDMETPMCGPTVFEIISTDIHKDGLIDFVIYRILLKKALVVDQNAVIIERRYSHFEQLHVNLHKHFRHQMDLIVFPKKRLFGNFSSKTIAKRSRAFEHYLTYLYSLHDIRFSRTFLEFFCITDMKEAYRSMLAIEYGTAILKFQQVLNTQEKILGDMNLLLGETLCALVACCQAVEDNASALKYGRQAMKCYVSHEDNTFYLPLLQSCIQLCGKLRVHKEKLEEKWDEMKREAKEIPSLLSVVLSSVSV